MATSVMSPPTVTATFPPAAISIGSPRVSSVPVTSITAPGATTTTSSPPPLEPPTLSVSPDTSTDTSEPRSEPSTPTIASAAAASSSSSTSIVPAYPFNVSMVPQNHNGPLPDDLGITTKLPSICVDYLSHDWEEDDIWTSWKAMTRHKAEIANGVRLENASWRTWAKQRGKLKTISPETLNWLKDSDVTWLYGPLHTAVEAVPPPRVATASERLGLEPLRTLSDAKKDLKDTKAKPQRKPPIVTKPILKYRSLSDILLPPGAPSSPVLESSDFDMIPEEPRATFVHARSDSNLWRMNSATRRKKRSPTQSPRDLSPEPAPPAKAERRHISFNHRVEQCIAVDSVDEANKWRLGVPGAAGSDDDGDDEDDVLTFKSSPRVATFGAGVMALHTSGKGAEREPHTIARLGPTTLKSTEQWPSPSPAVVYSSSFEPDSDEAAESPGRSTFAHPVPSYSANSPATTTTNSQPPPIAASVPPPPAGRRGLYDPTNSGPSNGVRPEGGKPLVHGQWDPDDDEDYAMGFDYYNGPDVGLGDEYDMAQYGSQHLIGNSHNNYQGGSAPFLSTGGYNPYSNHSPSGSNNTSNDSSPAHSRKSSNNPSPADASSSPASPVPVARGPHSPAASREAGPPKRSILKGNNRSRESSSEGGPRFGSVSSSPTINSPSSSGSTSPVITSGSLSPQSSSPYSSSTTLNARQSRPAARREPSFPDDVVRDREGRGRSASRGSSSSLERSASADRRSSVSPASSYTSLNTSGSRPIGIPSSRRGGGGSTDSLNTLAGQMREPMPDLVEASSESETEVGVAAAAAARPPIPATMPDAEFASVSRARHMSNDSDMGIQTVEDAVMPSMEDASSIPNRSPNNSRPSSVIIVPSNAVPDGPKSPPLVPAPPPPASPRASSTTAEAARPSLPTTTSSTATSSAQTPGPRFRQPSPSGATTSTSTSTSAVEADARAADTPSLSGSPALEPADLASTQWSDETLTPSYARRSLLRASQRHSPGSVDRDESAGRGSIESGRGSTHDDSYGFGYYDEDGESGIVGRTLEAASTAKDLLGAITKGIFGWRST